MPSLDLPSGTDWTISPLEPTPDTPDACSGCIRYRTLAGGSTCSRAPLTGSISTAIPRDLIVVGSAACNIPALPTQMAGSSHSTTRTFQGADVDGGGDVESRPRSRGNADLVASASRDVDRSGRAAAVRREWMGSTGILLTIHAPTSTATAELRCSPKLCWPVHVLFDKATGVWSGGPMISSLTDQAGSNQPQYCSTIACADIDGDGQAKLIARGADGVQTYNMVQGHGRRLGDVPSIRR